MSTFFDCDLPRFRSGLIGVVVILLVFALLRPYIFQEKEQTSTKKVDPVSKAEMQIMANQVRGDMAYLSRLDPLFERFKTDAERTKYKDEYLKLKGEIETLNNGLRKDVIAFAEELRAAAKRIDERKEAAFTITEITKLYDETVAFRNKIEAADSENRDFLEKEFMLEPDMRSVLDSLYHFLPRRLLELKQMMQRVNSEASSSAIESEIHTITYSLNNNAKLLVDGVTRDSK